MNWKDDRWPSEVNARLEKVEDRFRDLDDWQKALELRIIALAAIVSFIGSMIAVSVIMLLTIGGHK